MMQGTGLSRAYIGLGSNLDQPARQVRKALVALGDLPSSRLLRHSRLYHSPPMGPVDQPDFINAVALIETALLPLTLLDALQAIEQEFGRVRTRRWGERIIDLDILLYDDVVMREERLVLPHPGIAERGFVLRPLSELEPHLTIPGLGSLADALAARANDACAPLEETE